MLTYDIQTLLNHLNPFCTRVLESAAGLCVSRTHCEVSVKHVFAKLVDDPQADLSIILRQFKFEPISVKQALD